MITSTDQLLPAIVPTAVVCVPAAPATPSGVHPAALLFPMMQPTELSLLVEDIDAHGLLEPIVVFQGLLLDGRNRLRACEIAGVEPRFVEWEGVGSPLAFVLSRNLHRRHLNESQRSVIAARAKVMFEDEAAERERDECMRFVKRSESPPRRHLMMKNPEKFPRVQICTRGSTSRLRLC